MHQQQHSTMRLTLIERIESLKAAILSGSITVLVFSLFMVFNDVILIQQLHLFPPLTTNLILQRLIQAIIAAMSGFLFGVTYRYIVRSDQSFHLSSGAVLAFGLVRGLGEVEIGLNTQNNGLLFTVMVVESILLFAAAQVMLDVALKQGWIKPFQSN